MQSLLFKPENCRDSTTKVLNTPAALQNFIFRVAIEIKILINFMFLEFQYSVTNGTNAVPMKVESLQCKSSFYEREISVFSDFFFFLLRTPLKRYIYTYIYTYIHILYIYIYVILLRFRHFDIFVSSACIAK